MAYQVRSFDENASNWHLVFGFLCGFCIVWLYPALILILGRRSRKGEPPTEPMEIAKPLNAEQIRKEIRHNQLRLRLFAGAVPLILVWIAWAVRNWMDLRVGVDHLWPLPISIVYLFVALCGFFTFRSQNQSLEAKLKAIVEAPEKLDAKT